MMLITVTLPVNNLPKSEVFDLNNNYPVVAQCW